VKRTPVKSKSIVSVGYAAETATLEIEFQGGRVYHYLNVPSAAHRLLLQAPSLGTFLNRHIRTHFTAVRVS
jgi:hypothetical protein